MIIGASMFHEVSIKSRILPNESILLQEEVVPCNLFSKILYATFKLNAKQTLSFTWNFFLWLILQKHSKFRIP